MGVGDGPTRLISAIGRAWAGSRLRAKGGPFRADAEPRQHATPGAERMREARLWSGGGLEDRKTPALRVEVLDGEGRVAGPRAGTPTRR